MKAKNRNRKTPAHSAPPAPQATAFTFGEPERVLSNSWLDYDSLARHEIDGGGYFLHPVTRVGIAKTTRANAYHNSCIYFRRNALALTLLDNKILNVPNARAAMLDFETFGHAYLQAHRNRTGVIDRLTHLPAINMVRLTTTEQRFGLLNPNTSDITKFKAGEVLEVKEDDVMQGIYGIPDWLGGLHAVLLSEDATLFRRRYYNNGAHAGFIMVAQEQMDPTDEETLKKALKNSKGVGNFRSIYVSFPRGTSRRDPLKLIPVGDIATKDEFESIKRVTQEEILAMHRMRPELGGLMPSNAGGFGDPEKGARVYSYMEVGSQQQVWRQLNEHLPPQQHLKFKELDLFADPT